jgi:hypothetical protein
MSYAERTLVICNHGGSDLSFHEMMEGDNLTEEHQEVLDMDEMKKDHRLQIAFMYFYVGSKYSIHFTMLRTI